MYIKKSVLIICSVVLAIAIAVGTVMVVNPFGALQFDDLLKFNIGIRALEKYFYEDVDSSKIIDGALLGVSYSVDDPYTVYMDKDAAESFTENIDSEDYTGVGLYISNNDSDGYITIISPLSGSPAEEAGLLPGDKILEVNGKTVVGRSVDEIASEMKGQEGTSVTIKVLKKANEETVELSLVRSKIKRDTVHSKMLHSNIGYIQITQFAVNTHDEFAKHFNGLVDQDMDYVVIDLRNNPGGYVDVAVSIADCFIEEGEIVYTLDKYGNKRDYMATKEATKVPMAILVNEGSASASEIFVAAMRDYNLATVIGEKTFGKGVTQRPYLFKDGSILKITDSRYYTPKGECIDKLGITPDIVVEMSDEAYSRISELEIWEDKQLSRAVDVLLGK